MTVNVLTGARSRFTLNGVTIALATDWAVDDDIQYNPIEVLDNIEVTDHIAIGYTCAMTASTIRLVRQTLVSQGFAPRKGQTPADFLRNILTQPGIVAQLEDTQDGIIVGRVLGVKLATRRLSVQARGLSATNLTFVARRFIDQAEITQAVAA